MTPPELEDPSPAIIPPSDGGRIQRVVPPGPDALLLTCALLRREPTNTSKCRMGGVCWSAPRTPTSRPSSSERRRTGGWTDGQTGGRKTDWPPFDSLRRCAALSVCWRFILSPERFFFHFFIRFPSGRFLPFIRSGGGSPAGPPSHPDPRNHSLQAYT